MLIFILLVLCGIWAGSVASGRGANAVGWFFLGCLLPILFVPLAYTVGKECGSCRKKIHGRASICPHCMTRQTTQPDRSAAEQVADAQEAMAAKE